MGNLVRNVQGGCRKERSGDVSGPGILRRVLGKIAGLGYCGRKITSRCAHSEAHVIGNGDFLLYAPNPEKRRLSEGYPMASGSSLLEGGGQANRISVDCSGRHADPCECAVSSGLTCMGPFSPTAFCGSLTLRRPQ